MLKEEPNDALTHLASNTGADVCIPLDDTAPLFGEMFDGLILPDTYSTLLTMDDMNDSSGTNGGSDTIGLDFSSVIRQLPSSLPAAQQQHHPAALQPLQEPLQHQQHQQQQQQSQSHHHHHAIVDPYMSYREDSSCDTPNQLSPSDYSKVIIYVLYIHIHICSTFNMI